MRRETITSGKIIELTSEVLHGFYGRSIEHLIHYLSDDFIWIGAFDFQYTIGKQQFLDTIKSELNSTLFVMYNEQYDFITRERDTFILCCKFNLTSTLPTSELLQLNTRLSIVWKYIDNELKIVHIHGSNAQGAESISNTSQNEPDNFMEYLTKAISKSSVDKKMFRLTTGEHCVLDENEILYLQADGQNTKLHTKEKIFALSGVMRSHQENLSNNFFRIHKSYVINTVFLTSFQRYQVTLNNQISLPVGKEKYLSLKAFCSEKLI